MSEKKYADYSMPVYTSLMEDRLFFGVGDKAFYTLLILTILLASIVSVYCIALGIIGLMICRKLCKNEHLLIDFLFDSLMQSDFYEG